MTQSIEYYLTVEDFVERIPGIPNAFSSLKNMNPFWVQLREGWLRELLPADHPFWASDPVTDSDHHKLIRVAFRVFAVYAIWADYVLQGSVAQTTSGLVVKAHDQSDPINDRQRAELYRKYQDQATRYARILAGLAALPVVDCAPVTRAVGGVRVSSVRPRDSSPF